MASEGISLVYVSCRDGCRFKEWFVPSLLRQYHNQVPIQLIFVDYFFDDRRFRKNLFPKGIEFLHTLPLPTPFQGRYKRSVNDYFAVSAYRNCGLIMAKYDYCAFADDLSILGEHWLESVIEGMESKSSILGVYQKVYGLEVTDDVITASVEKADGIDSRLAHVSQDKTKCHGAWLYGSSFSLPLENALQVNGFDELCTPIGLEDVQMGIRLERTGVDMYLDKRMFTTESSELHYQGKPMLRIDPDVGEERYMSVLKEFGYDKSSFAQIPRFDASHMILDLTELSQSPLALGNRFDLFDLREKVKAGKQITDKDMNFPLTWWVTGNEIEIM